MSTQIPPEIEALWRSGDKVLAIKQLRDATGMGLAETKAALEAALDATALPGSAGAQDLAQAIQAAMARGDKVQAVKLLRDATGLGLKEAKDRVESGDPRQWVADTATAGTGPAGAHPFNPASAPAPAAWSQPGYEPGKVPARAGRKLVLALLIMAAALAAWYFGLRQP